MKKLKKNKTVKQYVIEKKNPLYGNYLTLISATNKKVERVPIREIVHCAEDKSLWCSDSRKMVMLKLEGRVDDSFFRPFKNYLITERKKNITLSTVNQRIRYPEPDYYLKDKEIEDFGEITIPKKQDAEKMSLCLIELYKKTGRAFNYSLLSDMEGEYKVSANKKTTHPVFFDNHFFKILVMPLLF